MRLEHLGNPKRVIRSTPSILKNEALRIGFRERQSLNDSRGKNRAGVEVRNRVQHKARLK